MRPSKDSPVKHPMFTANTKLINRDPKCDFNIKSRPRIKKNSAIYKMLKHGPLPDGDFTYLLRDGKITKYGRWLLLASDMDLRFVELCLLVKIYSMSSYLLESNVLPLILREWLFGQFCFDFEYNTIRNALATLKNRDFITITALRSVSCTKEKIKEVKSVMGDDFSSLHDYIEEIMSEDLFLSVG